MGERQREARRAVCNAAPCKAAADPDPKPAPSGTADCSCSAMFLSMKRSNRPCSDEYCSMRRIRCLATHVSRSKEEVPRGTRSFKVLCTEGIVVQTCSGFLYLMSCQEGAFSLSGLKTTQISSGGPASAESNRMTNSFFTVAVCSDYRCAGEHFQDFSQNQPTTVSQFLTQLLCNRLANFPYESQDALYQAYQA